MIQTEANAHAHQDRTQELAEPQGVSLRPTEIQILFEDLTLEDDLEDLQPSEEFKMEGQKMGKDGEETEPEQDPEQQPNWKRGHSSVKEDCQKSVKLGRLLNSLNCMDKKPTKRIHI